MFYDCRLYLKKRIITTLIGDLVLIVLIGNASYKMQWSATIQTLSGGNGGYCFISAEYGLSYLMYRFKSIRKLVQSEPVTLIYEGKYYRDI